jgi:hypothetical protein
MKKCGTTEQATGDSIMRRRKRCNFHAGYQKQEHRHTLVMFNTCFFSTETTVTRTRLAVMLYYIACLFFNSNFQLNVRVS